ncbi:MAG: hypothetical protein MJY99_07595 [Fibrobacter sp.]|nr:hypothetical protein [Fibrobacter sp.]
MIRLNLIEAAEKASLLDNVNPVHVTDIAAQGKSSKKKAITVLVAAVFAVVAFSCFISVFGVPKQLQGLLPEPYLDLIGAEDPSRAALTLGSGRTTTAGGSLEAQAAAADAAIKQRESLTVKQVVGEINPQALYNNNRKDFFSFLPLEKLSFQRSAIAQFLSFLNTAAPDDVGFSDCVFQSPNFYYVRGVSAKPTSQRSFLERIKTVSENFKTPPLPENAPATDITAFGQFNVQNVKLDAVTTFVHSAELAEEIKALKELAVANKITFSGLEKPSVEDFGVYKRYAYQVSFVADFPQLQQFAVALAESKVRVGIQKVDLKLVKRDMQASVRMEVLVVP